MDDRRHWNAMPWTTKRFKGVYYVGEFLDVSDNVINLYADAPCDGATGARDEKEKLAWPMHDALRGDHNIPISTTTKDLIMYDILVDHKFNMFESFIRKYVPRFIACWLNPVMVFLSPKLYLFGVTMARPFMALRQSTAKKK